MRPSEPGSRPTASGVYWHALAVRQCRRVNFAWWLEKVIPLFVAANLLGALGLLLMRQQAASWAWAGTGYGVLLVAAGLLAWVNARPRFHTPIDALARLDTFLGLKGRLLAAEAGKAAWPKPVELPAAPYRPQPGKPEAAAALSLAFIIGGALVPLGAGERVQQPAERPSPALEATLARVEQAREAALADPRELDAIASKLEALRQLPQEEWFRHDTLEAAEHLYQQTEYSLQELGRGLDEAAAQLRAAASAGERGDAEALSTAADGLGEATRSLVSGNLPAHPETTGVLRDLARQLRANGQQPADALASLDPQQLRELVEKLESQGAICRGTGAFPGEGERPTQVAGSGQPAGESGEDGKPAPGTGGVDRGPGAAPMVLSGETESGVADPLALNNEDLTRAALGDVLDTRLTLPPGREAAFAPGTSSAPGADRGADEAVWRESHTPEERRLLREYFK